MLAGIVVSPRSARSAVGSASVVFILLGYILNQVSEALTLSEGFTISLPQKQ